MRIQTKIISLVAGVLFGTCTACGVFAVNQYMNVSIKKLAVNEMEKLELAERGFSQIGSREDFDKMGELARDAYLKYQFEHFYQKGYALLKGQECIKNMTDYEITAPEVLEETYEVQRLGESFLLLMKRQLPYPEDFWVLSVKDITSTWEEGKEQARSYLAVFTVVFTVSIVIVAVVIRYLLKALEKLQAQAERIKGGDFSDKVVLKSRDELKELSDSLNSMSDQIQQQIEDLKLLLGAMAHEMKTPLTSIIGYADSLLHVRLSDQQKEQSLEAIYRCAGRLNQMSGKLLQLIGFYENQEIEMEAVDFVEVIKDIYEENKKILEEKEIRLELLLEDNEGIKKDIKIDRLDKKGAIMTVYGDKLLLTSLFANLISNSIKAFDNFGEIKVILNPKARKITVQDNGRGIPLEDIPHVTKAFYMVDKSRSRRQQGAGLGLALAERIAKAHHASLEIESCLGEGTKVTVMISGLTVTFDYNL